MDRRRFLELSGGGITALLAGCGGGSSSSGGASPPPAGVDYGALAAQLQGSVVLPADPAYASLRLLANRRFDAVLPAAIVRCAAPADVQAALAFVRRNGLAVAPRCGGHSWAGYSTTTGVVLNVTAMNTVQVNGDGTATIGAGARLAEVYDGLISQGVCIPSGTCLTVGISGITMGGGIGILDRRFGLTCDNLVSAQVVTTDGRLLACDESSEPDLFWALRGGGGGNFGVATSFTFRTHPTQDITVARATFLLADFAGVFQAWQAWPQSLPDTIWAQVYVDLWPGGTVFTVTAYCLGAVADMTPYWNAFLAATGAAPYAGDAGTGDLSPTVVQRGYRDVAWDMCAGDSLGQCSLQGYSGAGQVQRYAQVLSSDFFSAPLPDAGIQALVAGAQALVGENGVGSLIFDHMGGALGRVARDATAFPHRDALFSVEYATGDVGGGFLFDAAWPNAMRGRMATWSTGGAYVNYLDPLLQDWQRAYYGDNYARLQRVKQAYDPDGVLSMPQGIVPAG